MEEDENAGGTEGGRRLELTVDEDAGERLDAFLADRLSLSRTRIQKLIAADRIRVDGASPKKSAPVELGQEIVVEVPPPEPLSTEPEDIPLDIVYEDEALLVVNKPAGMVVHPAPGHPGGTLVNALLHHVDDLSGIGGKLRPGIVHRLDKDTSGLLVVAKSDRAHRSLSDQLRRREVGRLYRAASWGHLSDSPTTIDAPLGRDPRNRKRRAVVPEGKRAVTKVRVRERWVAAELLDVKLETGRTHQIRVHLAHLGHPVVGDDLYGAGWERGMSGPIRAWAREMTRRTTRMFLHATALSFLHPVRGETMRFRAPLPPELAEVADWAHETSASGVTE
ncbi:MAG: RluA family pseudouridine synthase [Longimicrobiales bacterium]|nr:RluA family pseudouridine synthase [Longimicrobiales bacterium]